jgi:hypothetical protein
MNVELVFLFLGVCPHLGDVGLPLAAHLLPLRQRLLPRSVGLVLELIDCLGRLYARATSASSFSLVP